MNAISLVFPHPSPVPGGMGVQSMGELASDDRPARWELHARAGHQSLAKILDFLDELPFVDVDRFIVLHHDPAIDDDGVHTAAISVIDQSVDRVEEVSPFR